MLKTKIKKIISILILAGLFVPQCSRAQAWPDIIGNTFGSFLTEELEEMHQTIIDTLKQAAAQTLASTVNNAIGGGSGGPLFITNWNGYLINDPSKNTATYVNNLLTQTYAGRNSALYSYGSASPSTAPAGSYNLQTGAKTNQSSSLLVKEGAGGNYFSFVQQAQNNLSSNSVLPQPDLQNYTANPSQLFASGWTAPMHYFDPNKGNTDLGLQAELGVIVPNVLQQQQMAAQTQAIANQGYKPVVKNGQVATPGSAVAAMEASSVDLPNKILASASSITGVATALVARLITKTITQGIWTTQKVVQSNISSSIAGNSSASSTPQNAFKPKY